LEKEKFIAEELKREVEKVVEEWWVRMEPLRVRPEDRRGEM
jgi:hypothetical protein